MLPFIIRRILRNGRRHWDYFCEYTELPGFRFMTSKVNYIVRISAITTFIFCLIGMFAQLYYLIIQYLRNQVQTSSKKYRIQHMALPIVYLCHQLDRKDYQLPLVDVCRESVFEHGSPDLANNELMRRVVPYCIYSLKLIDYKCELRCKWTSQGFCIETRLNHTSLDKTLTKNDKESQVDFSKATDYEIKIYFNSSIQPDAAPNTFALALVFLRFTSDAIKWPTVIPLVGAAHMIMERDALNILQVVEILKITRNDLPNSLLAPFNSSYEYCVWRTNSELAINEGWKCPSEFITNLFSRNLSDFKNVNYGLSKCAIQRANAAQQRCHEDKEFNRFTVESAIYTRSAAEADGLDPRNSPNLRVYPSDVAMQMTLHQLRSAEWKMMSEIGGTLALYLGFTLMGLLEAIVFLTVEHVRNVARQLDEEGQLVRKNPPIKKLFNQKIIKQFFIRKK